MKSSRSVKPRKVAFSATNQRLTSADIPHDVTDVALKGESTYMSPSLFRNLKNLRSIGIPEGTRCLPDHWAAGCVRLHTIYTISLQIINGVPTEVHTSGLPESCKTIGNHAFYLCKELNLRLSDKVSFIGSSAFRGSGTTTLTVPRDVYTIQPFTWADCTKLNSVVLHTDIYHINIAAFARCSNARFSTANAEDPKQITDGVDFDARGAELSAFDGTRIQSPQ